jgi:NAD(P)-dependent dehydrogenase (short-subunit alcohol dehydrogenase family)
VDKAVRHIKINAVDPGYTATDLTNHWGFQTVAVAEGADADVRLAGIGPDRGFFN